MTTNYTTEQVSYMIDKYEEAPTRETVEMLANELGKIRKKNENYKETEKLQGNRD